MISKVGLTLLTACLGSAAAAPPRASVDPQFHLSVYIVRGEHSRDSNSTTTTITIDGTNLIYDQSYSGFRASSRKPVHKETVLKPEDLSRLEAIIDSNKLLKSKSVKYDTGQPGSYFMGSIDIRLRSSNSSIRLSGMTNQIQDEGLYKKVRLLLDAIQNIVEP
jgi:hypothetical protein